MLIILNNFSKIALVFLILFYTETLPQEPTVEPEYYCLSTALWYEIRNGDEGAMGAVADVIINRSNAPGFPSSVCAVVFQKRQFSAFNGSWDVNWRESVVTDTDQEALEKIDRISLQKTLWGVSNEKILWYHTHNIRPSWIKRMRVQVKDRWHRFYSK